MFLWFLHCLTPLFYQKHYIVTVLLVAAVTFALMMWIWGYLILMFDDPGEINNEIKHCKNFQCKMRCPQCKSYKPYRTHHCSTCGKCYAKMDHHCAFLGKCVAIRNQKPFIVFLLYSIALTILWTISIVVTYYICEFNETPKILFVDLFGSTSLTMLLIVLTYEQIDVILQGRTTLEIQFNITIDQKHDKRYYWEEVFGPFSFDWFLPTYTPPSILCNKWEHLRRGVEVQRINPEEAENKSKIE